MLRFLILLVLSVCAVEPLRIHGLVAAVFTPFTKNGTVNYAVIEPYAEYLAKTNVKWVFVTGTTGESLSLTTDERKSLFDAWKTGADKHGLRVIAHVGAESLEDARSLTVHAQNVGVDALGCMPTVFFKPANVEALAESLGYIASGAPNLPFYYYHIPSMTGVTFPMYDLVKIVTRYVPSFAGVKYTGLYQYPSFHDVAQILGYQRGKFEVLGGRDEMMIETLATGVVGFVGSQYNFAGELYNEIYHQWSLGNREIARKLRLFAIDILTIIGPYGKDGKNANKYLMEVAGINIGPARLPNVPLTMQDKDSLVDQIDQWCSSINVEFSGLVCWCNGK